MSRAASPRTLGFPRDSLASWEEPSPFGPLPVVASPTGLRRIGLDPEGRDRIRLPRGSALVPKLSEELAAYFAGELQTFTIPLDLEELNGFGRVVTPLLAAIPYGATITYGELAARAGKPGGARAVGQAIGRNPLPIILPCHRVLAAGGKIGGFTGGLAIKRSLLKLEGALQNELF